MLTRMHVLMSRETIQQGRGVPLADYDKSLMASLGTLPKQAQAGFAAACAERLYPSYAAFLGVSKRDDHGLVRHALDVAWEGAKTGVVADADSSGLVERCVTVIPADDAEDPIPVHADDAIASVAYALQAAAGLDPRAAGWAAEQVTDSLDNFLLSNEIDINDPDGEQRVWDHPLVKAEVARREEDLRRLHGPLDWGEAVDAVRARATGMSALPLERLDGVV